MSKTANPHILFNFEKNLLHSLKLLTQGVAGLDEILVVARILGGDTGTSARSRRGPEAPPDAAFRAP
jgi:hypothetical protein